MAAFLLPLSPPTRRTRRVSTLHVDDGELVGLARQGDAAAFGELVDRHRTAVYRAALAALRSHADAEDAAQDAFVLKAAEIAMSARGSFDAKKRMTALSELFRGRLPEKLGEGFDPEKNHWGRSSKSELLELLAAAPNPEHRCLIVRAYRALLGEDDSIKRLPPNFCTDEKGKTQLTD